MNNQSKHDSQYRHLEERVKYLEEVNRFTNNALDLAVSLGDFPISYNTIEHVKYILDDSAARARRLIHFEALAYFLFDEETSDLCPATCEPPGEKNFILAELDHLIEKGLLGWTLGRKKPFYVASHQDASRQLLVQVIATSSRIRGLVIGTLAEDMKEIPDSSMLLLSIVMLHTANALESYELYRWVADINKKLEEKVARLAESEAQLARHSDQLEGLVAERTASLEMANIQLRSEIEERHKAEAALQKAHNTLEEKVQQRTDELKKSYQKLAHAGRLSVLGEMATGIAHEINQPLTVLSLGMNLLQKYFATVEDAAALKDTVDKLESQVARAANIVNNMRAFARNSQNRMYPIDLGEPVRQALSFFHEQFRLHMITLEENLEQDLPYVEVDAQKMEQIVINLLTNARYAVEDKRNRLANDTPGLKPLPMIISVRLYRQEFDNDIILAVEDNGIGMTPAEKEHCLEAFFTTKEVGQGTGLGLSIISGLVKEFSGTIEIDSQKDVGTVFRIRIPISSGDQQKTEAQ